MTALAVLLAVVLAAGLLLWSTEPKRTYHDLTPSHRRESLKTASAWPGYALDKREPSSLTFEPRCPCCGATETVCRLRGSPSVSHPALLTSTGRGALRLEKEALAARLRAEEIEARAKVAKRPAAPAVAPVATIAGRKRRGR